MKRKNGITLIALVVTIIVLLILAGVTITTISGDNGILTKASKAKEETDIGGDKEEINLALADYNMEENPTQSVEEYLKSKTDTFSDVSVFNGVITIKMKDCGHIYSINADGDINEEKTDGTELADDETNESLKAMISTWSVAAGQTIELPVLKMGQDYVSGDVIDIPYEYNITVDWGDGTEPESYSSEDGTQVSFLENAMNVEPEIMTVVWAPSYEYAATHTYTNDGIYQIKITGTFDAWLDDNWENPELLSIDQWGVTNTKEYAVYNVTESIASPSKNSFQNCSFLLGTQEEISIPRNAFYGVTDLYLRYVTASDIMIPASVQTVSIVNSDIYNIYTETNNANYTSVDGILYSKDKKTLLKYPDARTGEFIVPDFVEVLGENSFDESKLTSVKISDSVTTIKECAFDDNDNLQSIYVPSSVTTVEDYAMYLYNATKVYCEAESKPDGWSSSWNIRHSSNIEIIWGYTGN